MTWRSMSAAKSILCLISLRVGKHLSSALPPWVIIISLYSLFTLYASIYGKPSRVPWLMTPASSLPVCNFYRFARWVNILISRMMACWLLPSYCLTATLILSCHSRPKKTWACADFPQLSSTMTSFAKRYNFWHFSFSLTYWKGTC